MSTLHHSTISFPPSATPFPAEWTLADVRHLLGDISLNRIAVMPPIGTAMESVVERIHRQDGRLLELEFGILVEKTTGWYESLRRKLAVQQHLFIRKLECARENALQVMVVSNRDSHGPFQCDNLK